MPDLADLRHAVVEVCPEARLVPVRTLRRVIRLSGKDPRFRALAVHDRCCRLKREEILAVMTLAELGLDESDEVAEYLLIPIPDDAITPEVVTRLHRILFHAAIDREFDNLTPAGRLETAWCNRVRVGLGPARWHVIRTVLEEENLIACDADTSSVLRELAAFGFELQYFRPAEWAAYFPEVDVDDEPFATLRQLLEPESLAEKTRLTKLASDGRIAPPIHTFDRPTLNEPIDDEAILTGAPSTSASDLRAALEYERRGDPAGRAYVCALVDRLGTILNAPPHERTRWQAALLPVFAGAAAAGWPPGRRLLYELQRTASTVEQLTFAIDPIEWVITRGQLSIKRPLTMTKWLDVIRRLRAARRHAARLTGSHRELRELLGRGEHSAEVRARAEIRPVLASSLDAVGLGAIGPAEQASRDKLVEELLDAVCSRGFLRIGDVRDAIARNRVKLDDLSGPAHWLRGDALLQINRRLPVALDGVYRRGEIYMRALQRGCSLFFGTRPGRWLTLWLALPFGGSYLLIEALQHMFHAGEGAINWLTGWSRTVTNFAALAGGAAGTLAENPALGSSWVSWPNVAIVGVLLALLIHVPRLRCQVLNLVRLIFVKFPRQVWQSATVRWLANNAVTRFLRRYFLVPAASGGAAALGFRLVTDEPTSLGLVGLGTAVFAGSFFRTPLGREVEDRLDEAASRVWRLVSVNFVVGLMTLVLQIFRALFDGIDRAIYRVDEWLRFNESEGRGALVFKAAFSLVWFVLTYWFRFAWALLVEPQINPIKHFPVVTVSHKLLLPLIPSLAKQFRISEETMGTIVFGIPGIFGFLVWELKENWKLYGANASPTLRPAAIGSHGESMRALLCPGLHSGVVPKTFARLRKAVRTGHAERVSKQQHALDHVAEALQRFAERELVAYLRQSRRWRCPSTFAEKPRLTPNQMRWPIRIHADAEPIVVAIEERSGWLIASLAGVGPLARMDDYQRAAFSDALTGFYKRAGVHAVREQVAQVLGGSAYQFDATPEGLLVPLPEGRVQFYDYADGPEPWSTGPPLPANLVFSDCPLAWTVWARRWEDDAAGLSPTLPLLPGWTLVPSAGCTDATSTP